MKESCFNPSPHPDKPHATMKLETQFISHHHTREVCMHIVILRLQPLSPLIHIAHSTTNRSPHPPTAARWKIPARVRMRVTSRRSADCRRRRPTRARAPTGDSRGHFHSLQRSDGRRKTIGNGWQQHERADGVEQLCSIQNEIQVRMRKRKIRAKWQRFDAL